MRKIIVTLRDAPNASVEVPGEFPRKRGEKKKAEARKIERSVFGAIRLFPGIPKAISTDELEYVKLHRSDVFRRLDVRNYVESKRVDYRGASEAEIETLAEREGIGHLAFSRQVERLVERGKVKPPDPRKSTETRLDARKAEGEVKTTSRKPK